MRELKRKDKYGWGSRLRTAQPTKGEMSLFQGIMSNRKSSSAQKLVPNVNVERDLPKSLANMHLLDGSTRVPTPAPAEDAKHCNLTCVMRGLRIRTQNRFRFAESEWEGDGPKSSASADIQTAAAARYEKQERAATMVPETPRVSPRGSVRLDERSLTMPAM